LARIILSHALLESIRFVMSRKECWDIYGLINSGRSRCRIHRGEQAAAETLMHF
jgi:hypothetical protein